MLKSRYVNATMKAEAICEAALRHAMRFVVVRMAEQQARGHGVSDARSSGAPTHADDQRVARSPGGVRGRRAAGASTFEAPASVRATPTKGILHLSGCFVRPSRKLVLVLACVLPWAAMPGAASAEDRCDGAVPLRIANLNPFHLPGAPASFGACVLRPGETELILSLDAASHLVTASSNGELMLIDGETCRPALAVRRGLGEGWEHWIELSAVSHTAGAFDGFIESWHGVFGLPRGGHDAAPSRRAALATSTGQSDRTKARPSISESRNRPVDSVASSGKTHAMATEQSSTKAISTCVLPPSAGAPTTRRDCGSPGTP